MSITTILSAKRWSVMIKNLKQAEFMNKQNSNLNEMEQALLAGECREATKPYDELSFSAEAFLTFRPFCPEKRCSHPLWLRGRDTHSCLNKRKTIYSRSTRGAFALPTGFSPSSSGWWDTCPSESLLIRHGVRTLFPSSNLDGMKRQLDEIEVTLVHLLAWLS